MKKTFEEKSEPIAQNNNYTQVFVAIVAAVSIFLNIFFISAYFKNSGNKKIEPNQLAQIQQGNPRQNNSQVNSPQSAQAIQGFSVTETDHIRGDFNASITLVEFSDFECPFCERHYPTLKKILNDYSGKVRLVYKHFPLSFHPNGQKAAESSECADEQGKFWEYHDKLFESLATSGYSLANFKQWAKDLGLNSGKFNECLDSGKYAQKVQADFREGTEKGVNGTPATFINGQLVSGALPYEIFKQAIDSLIKK